MDTILLLSIFLVFITAFVGSFIQRRKRDRVLADLEGFHANQERRQREVARTANPGLFLRWARNLKNFLNTFRDAINESLGMFLTRMKGTSTSILFRTQDERLQKQHDTWARKVGRLPPPDSDFDPEEIKTNQSNLLDDLDRKGY
ncbi:MAG: hypothetical protein U9R43_02385 [Thermodesulfobacteriota bacterium]|nr:hypothetical protein [Thermodesulfobacteriota bacterium]